jgi:hypothetical protein
LKQKRDKELIQSRKGTVCLVFTQISSNFTQEFYRRIFKWPLREENHCREAEAAEGQRKTDLSQSGKDAKAQSQRI